MRDRPQTVSAAIALSVLVLRGLQNEQDEMHQCFYLVRYVFIPERLLLVAAAASVPDSSTSIEELCWALDTLRAFSFVKIPLKSAEFEKILSMPIFS